MKVSEMLAEADSKNYYNTQIDALKPEEFKGWNFNVKMQLTSEHGKTNWMDLKPEQIEKIAKVLMGK